MIPSQPEQSRPSISGRSGGARRILVVAALSFLTVALPTSVGVADAAPQVGAGTATPAAPAEINAPDRVTGYTAHCRQRMAERRVGEPDVELTVLLNRTTARFQPEQQTWLYTNDGSNLRVVLNDDGVCVTVY